MLKSKLDNTVAQYYEDHQANTIPKSSESLDLTYEKVIFLSELSESDYKYFFAVPLVAYNYAGERINSSINPAIYVSKISRQLSSYLDNPENAEKYRKRKVELEIEEVPGKIVYHYSAHLAIIDFGILTRAFHLRKNVMRAISDTLCVNFVLKDSVNKVIKREKIAIPVSGDQDLKNRQASRHNFIYGFIGRYDNRMTVACESITKKIITEIEK
jgi:hypothetical protein